MASSNRPLLAVTMGDPAGIGPEVIVKAFLSEPLHEWCLPLVIGDAAFLERVVRSLDAADALAVQVVDEPSNGAYGPSLIDVLDLANVHPSVQAGALSAEAGGAAMAYVLRALDLARDDTVSGIVTAPINKEATQLAGYRDMGHMELFGRVLNAPDQATMLVSGKLRTVHLTTHHSLRDALDRITRERVLSRIQLTDHHFRDWGLARPRIAVSAINPHGGEGGHLGREEIEEIGPAVEDARVAGIEAAGPLPADSVFVRAMRGEFDAVVAMFHDQGHIPVKVHGFEESVSVALGLPLVRTSVDHGTAFDIAGKGIADATSTIEAIRTAAQICAGTWLVDG
ncbi:MAG: 4-hydroxythreonine-4-phosphate dehydrogenase PdxA [Dehalococcoidia bacterium]|nr:4-hydroxythreonine-4-phosphate dehydrogenase PdxA [Dehalococcoidia bacterium]